MIKIAQTSENNGFAMAPTRVLEERPAIKEATNDTLDTTKREELEELSQEPELPQVDKDKIYALDDQSENTVAPIKFTSVLREISFLLATAGSLIASGASLILGPKNPLRKGLEFFATQSVNLSLGWVAGITGVIDQIKNKDLPMIGIQIGDSLATLFSNLENKTMNRGVWIGLMNIFNFIKKHIPEKKNFSSFADSLKWSGEGIKRYIASIREKGFINALQDRKGSAFGISMSMFTILGSLLYLVTGNRSLSPLLRHAGGAISEVDKFNSDNHQNGRFKIINAGSAMFLSSIADVLGKTACKFNPNLEKPFAFLNQALNNYGRFFQLESQQVNELGHSYPAMSFVKAITAGAKNFLDLNNLSAYFDNIDDIQEAITKKLRNPDQSEVARTTQAKLLAA